MVPKTGVRFYQLIRDTELERKLAMRKTYWDKYPELKMMRNLPFRRVITFLFFSYMFMFSTAEYTQVMAFGYRCFIGQFVMTIFIVTSVYSFEYSIREMKITYMIPFMSVVMGGLSCYVCLFAFVTFTTMHIRPDDHFLITFHCFLLTVTTVVTFTLAKATDILWQVFFLMMDLSLNETLMEKLRNNSPVEEEEDIQKKNNKKKPSRKILIGRRWI